MTRYQILRHSLLFALLLFNALVAKSQSDCNATIKALDSIIHENALKGNLTYYKSNRNDTLLFARHIFNVNFSLDTSGTVSRVIIKKATRKKCTKADKLHYKKIIISLFSEIKIKNACRRILFFKIPITVEVFE